MEEILNGSQLDQNIFLDDKDDQKKNKQKKSKSNSRYSSTKIKARNMLTNLSYNRFNDSDFEKKSFIVDVATFIVQYLNLLSLDRKLETEKERKQVRFVWEKCLPKEFDDFLKQQDNYIFVSTQTLNYQKCFNIVQNFIEKDENNFSLLKSSVKEYFAEIRYVFAVLFSKIFCRINATGIKIKSKFDYTYYMWEKNISFLVKDPINYTDSGAPIAPSPAIFQRHQNEQKPIKIELEDGILPTDPAPVVATEDILFKSYQMATDKPKIFKRFKAPKEKFDSDRAKAKEKKRELRKRRLEEQLEENTRQLAMIKPTANKKLIIK